MSAFVDALRAADKAATGAPWKIRDTGVALSWSSYNTTPNESGTALTMSDFRGGVTESQCIDGGGAELYPAESRCKSGDDKANPTRVANDALIVLLRNAAPEIAALVEAAALVIKHRWPREGHLQPSLEQLESALADLDAKGGAK